MLFVLFLCYAIVGAIFGVLRLGKQNPQVLAPGEQSDEDDLHESVDEDHS